MLTKIIRMLEARPVRIAVFLVALVLLLGGAAVVNVWSGLEEFIILPSRLMRALWLPLVLLLVIVILGVIWGSWRLGVQERRVSQVSRYRLGLGRGQAGSEEGRRRSGSHPVDPGAGRARNRRRSLVPGIPYVVCGIGSSQASQRSGQGFRDS